MADGYSAMNRAALLAKARRIRAAAAGED